MGNRWFQVLRRTWHERLPIRVQLSLLVLALAVPFLFYVLASATRQADHARQEAGARMLASARLTASRLDDHVGDIYQMLSVLSTFVDAAPASVEDNDKVLQQLLPHLPPNINNVAVWAVDGSNAGAIYPRVRTQLPDASQHKFFRGAFDSNAFFVEAPVVAATNQEMIGVFAMPVVRQGVVVGVVSVSAQLKPLQSLLMPAESLPEGAVMTVTDVSGVVLARSLQPERWIGRNILAVSSLATNMGRKEGVSTARSADGVDRIAGFTMSKRMPWLVYVGVPVDMALAEADARLHATLAAGCVLLLAGLGLALHAGGHIARPLLRLEADAKRLKSGDLSHRSRVSPGGEIGALAATFNEMAATLQTRSSLLERSQSELRQITDNLPALISYVDPDRRLRFVNRAYFDWLGRSQESLVGKRLDEVYGEAVYATFGHHIEAGLAGTRVVYERDLQTLGGKRRIEVTLIPDFDGHGAVRGMFTLMQDITQRVEAEVKLRAKADFDSLTGLPNRASFLDRLDQALAASHRNGCPIALLFIDIDHFKTINDTFGHDVGDDLLKGFAQLLRAHLRSTDMAARLAGDEFTVILEGLHSVADAHRIAGMLVERTAQELRLGQRQGVALSASIGVAWHADGACDGPALLKRADDALYVAKRKGRNGYVLDTGSSLPPAPAPALEETAHALIS